MSLHSDISENQKAQKSTEIFNKILYQTKPKTDRLRPAKMRIFKYYEYMNAQTSTSDRQPLEVAALDASSTPFTHTIHYILYISSHHITLRYSL